MKFGKILYTLLLSIITFVIFTTFNGCGSKEKELELTFIDTNSGANFQWFIKTKVIPEAEKTLNIKIHYVVSSGPEIIQRIKTWKEGKGDIHILLIKPKDLVDILSSDIPLETLYPDKVDRIPNITKCLEDYLMSVLGNNLNGRAALFWRSQMNGICNGSLIPNPPSSWKELYERRGEWTGHIGMVRPDAKSSGGRRFVYCFLHAFGIDFSIPFEELKNTSEWDDVWNKFKELYETMHKPLASEPPILFNQFKKEDVWISVYATDYTLWSRDKGMLPETTKAFTLNDGVTAGADAYLVIPSFILEKKRQAAYDFVNFLLSDEIQLQLISTMWQYPGTEIWDKVPEHVWENIPRWEDIKNTRIRITNNKAFNFIREHTMEVIK